ncbi:alpha/beta hydrolase [Flexivirga caeni]|uniref:Esterase n=1 Tax=Flexivirga caeni TaxID=2294115 RepID=A0A3M9M249_9MICO|nr:alpha/beta hydrolase-fold protein [Flexivirga caeni]RNI19661.1 hypothetical protein EFY87_16325 [Flexivirga caeni]
MTLTGNTFWYTLIVATVVVFVATLALWTHVRGHSLLRLVQRIVLVLLCQLTAVAVAGVWVNNHFGLYASWSDLLGTDNTGALVMAGPPARTATFSHGPDGTLSTFFRGPQSRLAGTVLVWRPPQYFEKAYRHKKFPVIELLHGIPGEPENWLEAGEIPGLVANMMATHRLTPALVVMPEIDPGGVDTDCSNTPTVRGATWLAKDVPTLLRRHFRVLSSPRAWALAGLSTGGFCAIKLPMQYPKIFGIGASMDGDPFSGDPSVLKNTALRLANAPLELAKKHPPVELYAATSAQDKWSTPADIAALARAIQAPTRFAPPYIVQQGGHNWNTWRSMEPKLFAWINTVLESAH